MEVSFMIMMGCEGYLYVRLWVRLESMRDLEGGLRGGVGCVCVGRRLLVGM
jgi:hypothetical protein